MQDDILRGIKAIAEFRGEKIRRTYYLAEKGLIPVARVNSAVEACDRCIAARIACVVVALP